ncbi:DUF1292 domain-containing protein [Paenibacillus sp. P96]|uniref:DUF1292 domain-containing protein n=1 Tax=Paenibacillus zeirhizosphaerae TaxID=2987519 RepID=A0ABT9FKG6_9BACL|nr:DUF1292 domain-containing protein [Paenibacillus sp. P96]MDP4095228.1 DUF1292 domain-containing protein [Paenibacillus sp. P96]
MTMYSRNDLTWTTGLKEAFGSEVELEDEEGHSVPYSLEAEFEVGGQAYAVLRGQIAASREYELFRVIWQDGKPELTVIEDDDEWEDIAELYDECTFPE